VTGSTFFDPAHPSVEGFDQVARNNLITDCDDAVVQIEGCQNARVHHNTAVTQTGFAIFRLNQDRARRARRATTPPSTSPTTW
jgi:hypothetical protein